MIAQRRTDDHAEAGVDGNAQRRIGDCAEVTGKDFRTEATTNFTHR